MRLKLLPIIGSTFTIKDLLFAWAQLGNKNILEEFKERLSGFTQSRQVYLVNSGISAFFILLKALQEESKRKQVVIPAYTAGSLVVAIKKAGLIPVLCDISLDDFNLDIDALSKVVCAETLAVVCVHMFGIGCENIGKIREKMPAGAYLIEDCAQSMGSKIKGKLTGSFGDASFFSFGRSKNLGLYGGGCIIVQEEALAQKVESAFVESNIKAQGSNSCGIGFKTLAFSFGTNPFIYNASYPFIGLLRETAPPKDIAVANITCFQAGLGLRLLENSNEQFLKRHQNGIWLIKAFKEQEGVMMPKISDAIFPVFNRMPIIFRNLDKKNSAALRLFRAGIETSPMYGVSLHHMFELGYAKESFPSASYFAQHLMTLPVHPLVKQEDLEKIACVIDDSLKG